MKGPRIGIGLRGKVVLLVGAGLLWIGARHQISHMDERFFQPSVSGIKGLVLYSVGDYSGAAKAYRSHFRQLYLTERTADDPGWNALLQGDFQGAERHSREALEKDPSAVGPLLTLGEIALETNAFDEGLGILRRVLQKETDQYDALLLISVAQARSGRFGEAIDSMNRALRYDRIESRVTTFLQVLRMMGDLASLPKGQRPHCLLAHYYRYLRIFDPSNARIAISYARRAAAAGDRPDDAFFTLGVIYERQGKRDKALSAFLQAIRLNPKHAEAHRWAGIVYSERGDLLNEYQMNKAAFELAPEDSYYAVPLYYVLSEKLGDYHQALAISLKALQTAPRDGTVLGQVAYAYGFLGDYARSVEYYRRAVESDPRNPSLHEGFGWSLRNFGHLDEAIMEYRKAISLAPSGPRPHTELAKAYHQARRYKEAIAAYERAAELGDLSVWLCTLYHRTDDFQRAADCLSKVLAEDPNNQIAVNLLPAALNNLRLKNLRR